MLKLYNTLTRKKEVFKPINKSQVGMYSCGPTVYWYQHIGNLRTYVFSDILKRVLNYDGFKVKHVMNVTDVGHLVGDGDSGEDKVEEAAAKEHKTAKEIADYYLKVFREDLKKLHVIEPSSWLKASEHVAEQISLISLLEKKRYTYKTSDGIYFDTSKFKDYGKLARLNIKGLEAGRRVDMGEKKNKTDFALWKFSTQVGKRQQEWPSPWGVGYPGWHIECSAMAMASLGQTIDIHTGGEDHIPVHHTNEIAQSECATGKKFVNYWLHGSFLTFKGDKVSKSKGGLYTISELEKLGYRPEHYRYLCSLTHYRKRLDFSIKHLDAARTAFDRFVEKYNREVRTVPNVPFAPSDKKTIDKFKEEFSKAIDDDLNMPKAVQVLWRVLDSYLVNPPDKVELINKFDSVLGLDLRNYEIEYVYATPEVEKLLQERENARKDKNWNLADKIREKVRKLGYEIEDSNSGVKLKKVN